MTATDISLGEFVKQLIVLMDQKELKMLFKEERPWHLLFYKLAEESVPGKPDFFKRLRFDWDGPYPKSPELSRFIHALHWTGALAAVNPSYERVLLLSPEMKSLWSHQGQNLPVDVKKFLDHAVVLAGKEFPSEIQSAST